MLSTPHKRFAWAKSDRFSDFSFFRALLVRRRPPPAPRRKVTTPQSATKTWKPAPWTPWLWIK